MKAYLAAAYAIPTLIVAAMFARYADYTWSGVLHWGMFYFVGIVQPFVFARRALKQFDAHGIPVDSQLRHVAFYPVIIGGLTLLIGLSLLRDVFVR
jgi:hypothetical protein